MPRTVTPIERSAAPLRMQIIDVMREAILSGEFAPGDRLRERELCELWDVSRTVVREALRQLEADGLVTIIPNRGPVVATLTRDDAAALYEAREALEALAGRLFTIRATPEQLDALKGALADIEVAFQREDDPVGWVKAKDDFYDLLLKGSGNPAVADLLRAIQHRVRLLRSVSLHHPGRRSESLRELRAVVEAIADRDSDRVRDLLGKHVQNAGRAAFDELAATGAELAESVR